MDKQTFNALKAQDRALYEMAKAIKKSKQGTHPTRTIDGRAYLPYTKYTKLK